MWRSRDGPLRHSYLVYFEMVFKLTPTWTLQIGLNILPRFSLRYL
jgi:hypothetical protein